MWPFKRRKKTLKEVVLGEKEITVRYVPFTIKKIDMLNYLDGSKLLLSTYATWEDKKSEEQSSTAIQKKQEKLREHCIDVLLAGVVSPKLDRDPGGTGFYVQELFRDEGFAWELYNEIIRHSYNIPGRRFFFLKKS